jgi:glycosyltransferase involved in cell wall biosynthesis
VNRLLIATDAWHPQVNGVVHSLEAIASHAASFDMEVQFLTPERFRTLPLPGYDEIGLALATATGAKAIIEAIAPDFIHIATEGPIGLATRRYCLRAGVPFSTSYHTRFPEYIAARLPVPISLTYAVLRHFHNAGAGTMVSSQSLEKNLRAQGFRRLLRWTRGVDEKLFRPRSERVLSLPQPIFLYVGRIAVEKNVEAFLRLDLPGSKVVVGRGPLLSYLKSAYPQVHFMGPLHGEELARIYASCDVFVFPSLTDTFGIVLLEALASGLPIAAFPVMGPLDVIGTSKTGILDHDLRRAALAALDIPRDLCRAHAETFTWKKSAAQFFGNIRAVLGPSNRLLQARSSIAFSRGT